MIFFSFQASSAYSLLNEEVIDRPEDKNAQEYDDADSDHHKKDALAQIIRTQGKLRHVAGTFF